MNKKVLVAGGQCGTTMIRAGQLIEEVCMKNGIYATVKIQNVWETSYVVPGSDLLVEMFPFFENEKAPVISGRPFINHIGEKAVLDKIVELLKEGG